MFFLKLNPTGFNLLLVQQVFYVYCKFKFSHNMSTTKWYMRSQIGLTPHI